MHPAKRHAAAFTLVELLVCLLVVAVLTAVCVPVYGRVSEAGRAAKCIANLRQLGGALGLYLGDHNLTMPTLLAGRTDKTQDGAVIDNTLNAYLPDPRVFACPSDGGEAARSGTSYFWNPALNGQSTTSLNFFRNTNQTQIPILADKAAYHPYTDKKVNLLYADGHATQDLTFNTSSR